MKKILLIALVLIFAVVSGTALADPTFYPANEKSVAWNAVEDATAYLIFYKPADGGDAVQVGETQELEYTFVFDVDMQIIVGVQSVRRETVNDEVTEIKSEIAWSDNADDCEGGNTFGFYYFAPPAMPDGLRAP